MADTKKDELMETLQGLDKVGNIVGSAVISTDGLAISSNLKEDLEIETFAAMSAAMQGAAETAISELKQGTLNQIMIHAEKGNIITISAGEKAILVILTKPDINLGLVLLELKKVSKKISEILKI